MSWIYLAIAIVLTAAANLALKQGALRAGDESNITPLNAALDVATNPFMLAGIICLVAALLCYAISLRAIDLSIAYAAMTSSVIVLVGIASVLIFHEPISWQKLVGTALILAGVSLLSQSLH
ncbi:MAG: SMR family transporter [Phycisphaeraceae bacterium]